MADWTTLPDSSLEPGKPIRSIDGLALRDNPIAIAEGAAGAPRIDPIAAMAHQGQTGAVGTYAFLGETATTTTAPGGTRAGSALRYVSINKTSSWASTITFTAILGEFSSTPSGTWRCMGHSLSFAPPESNLTFPATLWLRIS
jgi:hypothetical protein